MDSVKLYCLPYAGGSAEIYTKWGSYLDSSIKLRPVELAGRASRYKEPYYNSMREAVDDIVSLIENELEESGYAIFGHSMGSIMAYELVCRLREKNLKPPMHIFFSGRYPPSIRKQGTGMHLLSETEFEQEALELGGISNNLFKFKGLLKTAMETLRADYKIIETHEYDPTIYKLDFNISVLIGKDDVLAAPSDMEEWKKYTEKQCAFYYFDGGHFYLHNYVKKIAQIINNTLVATE